MPTSSHTVPRIPDFELVRLIGSGSYGDVWLARGVTGAFRAVKIVWRDRFNDPRPYAREFEGITRFTAISLREPSQLALLHAGRQDEAGFFYYVMELADDAERGRDIDAATYVPLTLKEVHARRGQLPCAEVVELGVTLARALASLHASGLVHRDIKPSNIVFVGGVPKLADVGLVAEASAGLTFVGTEGFVPPEGPGAPSADVFSLGKVLYELATGLDRQDFPRLPPQLGERPDRKELLELNEVLIRACEPLASVRFPDAGALLDELLLLQAGKSIRRLRSAERRTARALRIAAVLAVIAAVAGTGAWVERTRLAQETERRRTAEQALADLARKTFYSASLARAQRALETGNLGLARRVLDGVVPAAGETDPRGFEWRALRSESLGDPADIVPGRGPALESISLSPDARLLAGETDDHRTTIWHAATLQPVRTIEGTHRIVGFSSDGAWLVGSDTRLALHRWEVATGRAATPVPPKVGVERPLAALGPDEILSLTADDAPPYRWLRIWNFSAQQDSLVLPLTLDDPADWTYGPRAVSSDGRICAVTLTRFTKPPLYVWRLQIYDLTRRRLVRDEAVEAQITAVCLSPDARLLALATTADVQVREVASNTLLWRRPMDLGTIDSLVFAPDSTRLAVAGQATAVKIVDARNGSHVAGYNGHDGGIDFLFWGGPDAQLLSAGTAGDLRRWKLDANARDNETGGFWAEPLGKRAVCLSPDASLFAATTSEDGFRVMDANTMRPVSGELEGCLPLALDPTARAVIAIGAKGILREYSLEAGNPIRTEFDVLGSVTNLAYAAISEDRRRLVAAGTDGSVRLWDLAAHRVLAEGVTRTGAISWVAISADGELAVSGGLDLMTRLWRPHTTSAAATWPSVPRATNAAISRDRRFVALGFLNGEVEIREAPDMRVVQRIKTDSPELRGLQFSADNRRLFCGGANGTIHVYDTADWRPLVALTAWRGPTGANTTVSHLAVDAGGTTLLAFRSDGRVRLWRTRP